MRQVYLTNFRDSDRLSRRPPDPAVAICIAPLIVQGSSLLCTAYLRNRAGHKLFEQ